MNHELDETSDDAASVSFKGKAAVSSVRWSLVGVLARQGFQVVCAIILARLLGPASYGIISAASIYTTFIALLLDQGLSAALIQRPLLSKYMAGAASTLNLAMALIIGIITWFGAPLMAGFFRAPELGAVLMILACGVPVKAAAITPRAMLSRQLLMRSVAISDISGAALGAVAGVTAAILGANYFAIVFQVITTDLITGTILLVSAKGPLPNFRFREVRTLLAFSIGIFGTNFLAYFSRNIDNILVGRFLGVTSLSLYGMAYRILVIPVQFIGQTVNRVMFPAFSRIAHDRELVAANLVKSTQFLALLVVPLMSFIACAAPQLVHEVLGNKWLPAAPLISVLAIGGAREALFYITPSLMKGMGKAALSFRYELLAAAAQVGGILLGLQYGILGVAIGLTAAGFALTPILLVIQSRLGGIRIRTQLAAIVPAAHASLWASAAYLAIGRLPLGTFAILFLGFVCFMSSTIAVLLLFHRTSAMIVVRQLRTLTRIRSDGTSRQNISTINDKLQ